MKARARLRWAASGVAAKHAQKKDENDYERSAPYNYHGCGSKPSSQVRKPSEDTAQSYWTSVGLVTVGWRWLTSGTRTDESLSRPALLRERTTRPASHQLQSDCAVQLRGPTDGDFQAPSRQQVPVRGEQNAVAAHVDGFADTHFIGVLAVEDLVADLPLDGEAVRARRSFSSFSSFTPAPVQCSV